MESEFTATQIEETAEKLIDLWHENKFEALSYWGAAWSEKIKVFYHKGILRENGIPTRLAIKAAFDLEKQGRTGSGVFLCTANNKIMVLVDVDSPADVAPAVEAFKKSDGYEPDYEQYLEHPNAVYLSGWRNLRHRMITRELLITGIWREL